MEWDIGKYNNFSQMQTLIGNQAIERLILNPTDRVLDIGCGTGSLSIKMATQVYNGTVMGIDVDQNMIKAANELISKSDIKNIAFNCIDVCDLEYKEDFSVVFSNIVIHWIKYIQQAFDKIYAALIPNGRVMIATIYNDETGTQIPLESKKTLKEIEMNIMQIFIKEGHYQGILTMDEFLAHQKTVFPNLTYQTHSIQQFKEIATNAKFHSIKITKNEFWHEFSSIDEYLDYRESNIWRFFLAFFPKSTHDAVIQKLRRLIKNEWQTLPENKKNLDLKEKWPILFIELIK